MVGERHVEIERKEMNCGYGSQKFMGKFRVMAEKENHLLRHKDRIESDQVCPATWKMGRRMRIAIISDIHANIEALESVFNRYQTSKGG